jgi:dynein heavy chain
MMNILSDVYTPNVVRVDQFKMSPSGIYFIPSDGPLSSYMDYIRTLPFVNNPEVFGMNDNADISYAINESGNLLSTALGLQPKTGGGGGGGGGGAAAQTYEQKLMELVASTSARVPDTFDVEAVAVRFPVSFEESLNTVLVQECMRFNVLTGTVKRTLKEVGLAIKGLSVMSAELEALGNSMVLGRVPDLWKAVAYPSVKPLASWVQDLVDRLAFLQKWIDTKKRPNVFWISGFFFTQSFLTGNRQNFARRHAIAIDLLAYTYRVLRPDELEKAEHTPPVDGVHVVGLFFQGAAWDVEKGVIGEARPRELFSPLPMSHLLPIKTADLDPKAHLYPCPVYKTSERAGLLSTTGHSTNFVMAMSLPIDANVEPKHWVKRGCALFTALDD